MADAPEPEAAPEASPPSGIETEEPPEAPPDWRDQLKDVTDPQAALAHLLKTVPIAELERNPTIAGWIGDMGNRRAQALIRQAERDQLEQQKREAAANKDYYGLGQQVASELAEQMQHEQANAGSVEFMQGVTRFQSKFPEEVQQQISGKQYGIGKSHAEGVEEYLSDVVDKLVSHRLAEAVETEMKKREPALRKVALSETNGTSPVPELDGSPAASVREITDEQIAAMSLRESEAYLDERGQPRPGVRIRLTRGIPITRR